MRMTYPLSRKTKKPAGDTQSIITPHVTQLAEAILEAQRSVQALQLMYVAKSLAVKIKVKTSMERIMKAFASNPKLLFVAKQGLKVLIRSWIGGENMNRASNDAEVGAGNGSEDSKSFEAILDGVTATLSDNYATSPEGGS